MTTDASSTTDADTPSLPNLRLGTAPDSWGVGSPTTPSRCPGTASSTRPPPPATPPSNSAPSATCPPTPNSCATNSAAAASPSPAPPPAPRCTAAPTPSTCPRRVPPGRRAACRDGRAIPDHAAGDVHRPGDRRALEPAELTAEQWTTLGDGHSELGRVLLDEYGVRQMFHPHADAHVDDDARITRFLELTDPAPSRCASTPATSRTSAAITGPSSPSILTGSATSTSSRSTPSSWPRSAPRVCRSLSRPSRRHGRARQGEPAMPPLLADLNALGVPLTAIVEHDLYPTPPDVPLPSPPAPASTRQLQLNSALAPSRAGGERGRCRHLRCAFRGRFGTDTCRSFRRRGDPIGTTFVLAQAMGRSASRLPAGD